MSLPTNPINRKESYLNAIATGNTADMPATPITREEAYLDYIAKNGGGGSGDGDMKKSVYDSDLDVANAGGIGAFVDDAVSGKVDKVAGKGLSTNDYSDTEKGKVADNTSAIEAIVNKYGAKNLYHNEYLQTSTWDNITITVNNTDKSISFVGTNTTANDKIFYLSAITLPVGKYTISGGAPYSEYANIVVRCAYNGAQHNIYDEDVTFDNESASGEIQPNVIVRAGKTVNFTLRFMIRDARITDPTYVPYTMTNRELTDELKVNESLVTVVSPYEASVNRVAKINNFVFLNYRINNMEFAPKQQQIVGYIPEDFAPSSILQGGCLLFDSNGYPSSMGYYQIQTNGNIVVLGNTTVSCTGFLINAAYIK